ncbi:hypothetical protein [Roseomonas indoligenes]|uniref:Uncharacterized protein n=1 Tax=Roseomonas indoligenes TaxID=2820811 RepID=A0A940N3W8_9PROT|nr:hypothetical protein [Pararoseomonas indoligenes]MBP0496232.1 hypothetical protein [Pararoseomonas indoligenes]
MSVVDANEPPGGCPPDRRGQDPTAEAIRAPLEDLIKHAKGSSERAAAIFEAIRGILDEREGKRHAVAD